MGRRQKSFQAVLKTKKDRAQKRKAQGKLTDLRISAKVKYRYMTALLALFNFWHTQKLFPARPSDIDRAASEFVEAQWAEGEPSYVCNDALAGLQHFLPLRGQLQESWKLLKTWHKKEPAIRVLPMHPLLLLGMAGLIYKVAHISVPACLLAGFDCLLRSGEIYNLERRDLLFYKTKAVLKLRETKTGKRTGCDEMVVCHSPLATTLLKLSCMHLRSRDKVLQVPPKVFRQLFVNAAAVFGIHDRLNIYSLRRGGATWSFLQHGSMELTLLRGRWQSSTTARIYLQDSVASASDLQLSDDVKDRLRRQAFVFNSFT